MVGCKCTSSWTLVNLDSLVCVSRRVHISKYSPFTALAAHRNNAHSPTLFWGPEAACSRLFETPSLWRSEHWRGIWLPTGFIVTATAYPRLFEISSLWHSQHRNHIVLEANKKKIITTYTLMNTNGLMHMTHPFTVSHWHGWLHTHLDTLSSQLSTPCMVHHFVLARVYYFAVTLHNKPKSVIHKLIDHGQSVWQTVTGIN